MNYRMTRAIAPGLISAVLVVLSLSRLLAQQAPFEDKGDFKLVFAATSDEGLNDYRDIVMGAGGFDEIVKGLNSLLILPYDITIRFEDNPQGPYYENHTIVMNYQFMRHHGELFVLFEYSNDAEEFGEDVLAVTEFVFYHELGHALVEAYRIPILGREEDAADSLAALLAAKLDNGEIALVAADAFDMQIQMSDEIAAEEFWDSHSLSEQRMFTLACLIYGSDPEQYSGLLTNMDLPADQEPRCIAEFQEKDESWRAVLSPFIKP